MSLHLHCISSIYLVVMIVITNNFAYSLRSLMSLRSSFVMKQTNFNSSKNLRPLNQPIPRYDSVRISNLISYIDSSPEPYHVVETTSKYLSSKGFEKICDTKLWRRNKVLKRGGKYYLTKNDSTIIAFVIGNKYKPGNGFKLIGAHTDSPNLKLKPKSKRVNNKMIQLNVECYGGGLWHTWFDRDLSIAGRVIVQKPDPNNQNDFSFETKLVKINRSILRIPNLCIHLRTPEERDAFKVNKEDHLMPILSDEITKKLDSSSSLTPISSSNNESDNGNDNNNNDSVANSEPATTDVASSIDNSWQESQHSELLQLLAEELSCSPEHIVDFELSLFDTQNGAQTGLNKEYICSSRIDNLASCFVAMEALGTYADNNDYIANDEDVSCIALFDHEEVGSQSQIGAGSIAMRDIIERITLAFDDNLPNSQEIDSDNSNSVVECIADRDEALKVGLAKSMILSVDMAHAVHPNYASKHDKHHSPQMNSGLVIKTNVNQRYATSGITGFIVRELGRKANVPIQEFSVRNDCPCGSTIGPIISQNTGVRAVDLGMPQLSMHSIREMMGGADLTYAHDLFVTFFKDFRKIDSQIKY